VPFYPPPATSPSFGHLLRSFAQGGPDDTLLTEQDIDQACQRHHVCFAGQPDAIWTPALTLWAFLWQCASAAKTCSAACARALAWRLALGLGPCSVNTGAFCKNRAKLPEPFLRDLCTTLAGRLEAQAPDGWRWRGRAVKVIDGTVCTAADTEENQKEYPQRDNLPGGVGFPLVRLVVLFGLATAACLDAVFGAYSGKGAGETTLARLLLARLSPGDVVLGDRIFATYWLIAGVRAGDADCVFRLHAHRRRDGSSQSSRLQRALGQGDNLVVWARPKCPAWMDEATYAAMPKELRVRIVWRRLEVPGFRTKEIEIVTTLLDEEAYPATEVVSLYRRRWSAELNLRSLKAGMKMEHLWCKTPEMVRKEVWGHLLAYNLVRAAMAAGAVAAGEEPSRLSFACARGLVEEMRGLLSWAEGPCRAGAVAALARAIGSCRLVGRPDRIEPRAVKRGLKPFPRLRQTREKARQRAAQQAEQKQRRRKKGA
jgi:putative transposase